MYTSHMSREVISPRKSPTAIWYRAHMVLELAVDSCGVPFKIRTQTERLCLAAMFRAGISAVVHRAVVFAG